MAGWYLHKSFAANGIYFCKTLLDLHLKTLLLLLYIFLASFRRMNGFQCKCALNFFDVSRGTLFSYKGAFFNVNLTFFVRGQLWMFSIENTLEVRYANNFSSLSVSQSLLLRTRTQVKPSRFFFLGVTPRKRALMREKMFRVSTWDCSTRVVTSSWPSCCSHNLSSRACCFDSAVLFRTNFILYFWY